MTPPPPPQSIIAFFATALISPLLSVLLKLGNEELETNFKTFFHQSRQDRKNVSNCAQLYPTPKMRYVPPLL